MSLDAYQEQQRFPSIFPTKVKFNSPDRTVTKELYPYNNEQEANEQRQGIVPQTPRNPYADRFSQPAGATAGSALGNLLAGSGTSAAVVNGTIPAGATVPAGYTAVGTAANGGTMVAPVAGASSNPGLAGIVAGAYTGYQQAGGVQRMAEGKSPKPQQSAALFPITGGLDQAVGPVTSMFGSKKDKDQQSRDKIRAMLRDKGFIDQNYHVRLADDSVYDIGIDGKDRPYNVDFSNKAAGQVVGATRPLALLMTDGDDKLTSDFTGYLTNAALSNGSNSYNAARKNVLRMYADFGLGPDDVFAGLKGLLEAEKINQNEYHAAINALNDLIVRVPQGQGGQPQPQQNQQPVIQGGANGPTR